MPLEVFTADDWDITVTLKKDGAAYDVSTATDISAAVVSDDGTNPTTIIAATSMSAVATGADWANGVVVCEFAAANTDVSPQNAFLEIQVTLGGKKTTWPRNNVVIKKGTIA